MNINIHELILATITNLFGVILTRKMAFAGLPERLTFGSTCDSSPIHTTDGQWADLEQFFGGANH